MTPAAAISLVISDYDCVDPTDVDNAALRLKYLRILQHIYNHVWSIREWEWTYREDALTFAAGEVSAQVPDDFQSIGHQGMLYDPNGVQYLPRARYVVERLRRAGSSDSVFSTWGGEIQIPQAVSADTIFTFFYRFRAETLADDATEMTIPDRYAYTVLVPGLVFRSRENEQDARDTWSKQFNAGISQMAAEENPSKFEDVRMPMSARGMW